MFQASLNYYTNLDSIWEWLHPFCSHSVVGSLKEPKHAHMTFLVAKIVSLTIQLPKQAFTHLT